MKFIIIPVVAFLALSCANTKKTSDFDVIDQVIVSNMVEGHSLSVTEANEIITAFKSQHPGKTPTMLNNAMGMVSILAKANGGKPKMFSGTKTAAGWKF